MSAIDPPVGMIPMTGSKKGGWYDPVTGQTRYDQVSKYRKTTPKGVAETQKMDNARSGGEVTSDPVNPGSGGGRSPRRGHQRDIEGLEQTSRVEIGHFIYTNHVRDGEHGWVEMANGRPTGRILSSNHVLALFHKHEGDPIEEAVHGHLDAEEAEMMARRDEANKQLAKLASSQGQVMKGASRHSAPPPASGRTIKQLEEAPEVRIGAVVYHRHKVDGHVSWVGYHAGVRTGRVHDSQWVLDHWNWASARNSGG